MNDTVQTMRPSNWQLLVHQVRYQNRVFWRSPVSAFFTLIFPLMFLVVLTAVIATASSTNPATPWPNSMRQI